MSLVSAGFAGTGETTGCEVDGAGAVVDAAVEPLSGLEAIGEFPQPLQAMAKDKVISELERFTVISFFAMAAKPTLSAKANGTASA
jgi:hypothetical protein